MLLALVVLIAAALSVIASYLAISEKDPVTTCIYLALFGVFYALVYYVLMAPDVVLAYIPISSTIVPALLVVTVRKLRGRCEDE